MIKSRILEIDIRKTRGSFLKHFTPPHRFIHDHVLV
jgi:hypothetical protein